jgi:predicted DCC family thiol-disulfide oxidoreductase YuxK
VAIDTFPSPAVPDPEVSSLIVLYDGDCGVCIETIRQLRRWDHESKLQFLTFREASLSGRPSIERLVADGGLGEGLHVVDETAGRVVSGGHAALAILDALPGGWLLRPWAILPTTGLAADVVYRVASRHRDRLAWLVGLRDEVSCPPLPGRPARPTG